MRYYIVTDSRFEDTELFMVDRRKCDSKWWDDSIAIAMAFESKQAAKDQCRKLCFNNPKVVSRPRALEICARNLHEKVMMDLPEDF